MTDLLDLLTVFGTCAEEEPEEDPEVAEWSCGDPLEYQGYDYETVQIGEQCWFAENLRAESYRMGTPFPRDQAWRIGMRQVGRDIKWLTAGFRLPSARIFRRRLMHCDPAQSLDTYGLLYNNFAVT